MKRIGIVQAGSQGVGGGLHSLGDLRVDQAISGSPAAFGGVQGADRIAFCPVQVHVFDFGERFGFWAIEENSCRFACDSGPARLSSRSRARARARTTEMD